MNMIPFGASISMTSKEIASLVEKRHHNVKRTIDTLVEQGVILKPQIEFLEEISNLGLPVKREYYRFPIEQKRDTYIVVAQLSPEFTARLVDRWEELEHGKAAPIPAAHPMQIARIIVSEYLEISKLFEVPQHYAQIEAVKEAHSGAGVDLSPLLLRAPAQDRIKDHELMLEPTELGKHYGVSAVKMNQRLAEAGLQVKTEAGWEATDAGKHISVRHAWKNKMKSGYNYKWKVSAVKSIIPVDD